MPSEQVGHADGEWMFDGKDWVQSYANSKPAYIPQASRGSWWYAVALLFVVAVICCAPPLARMILNWIR
jgi:hypothetical protein